MSFPLFFDEDVDVRLALLLRQSGHDVLTTQEAGRASQAFTDEDQLDFATRSGRALFTHNVKDFVALAIRWHAEGRTQAGIIVCERRHLYELRQRLLLLFEAYPEGLRNLCVRPPPLSQ